jgi:hypothetical protein
LFIPEAVALQKLFSFLCDLRMKAEKPLNITGGKYSNIPYYFGA